MNKNKVVDVSSARSEEYKNTLKDIHQSGECPAPFCIDEAHYHKHPILFRSTFWKVTRNSFNYQNAEHAFLIVLNSHVEDFLDVSDVEWSDLREVITRLKNEYDLKGYTLLWRMGETSHTGASVNHIHAHLICGFPKPETVEKSDCISTVVGYANTVKD